MEKYRNISGKLNSLMTFLVYDIKTQDLIEKMFQQLKKIQTIYNQYKKKLLNDRIYNFIEFLKEIKDKELKHIFLLENQVHSIKLSKKQLSLLREYNVRKYTFTYGDRFDIDYLQDVLTNMKLYNVFYCNNNTIEHKYMNTNKYKTIKSLNSDKFEEYIKTNKINKYVITGLSSIINKLKDSNAIILKGNVDKKIIIEEFKKEEMKIIHKNLQITIDMLQNENVMNKIVYGKKEIGIAIEGYMIKELFVHKNKYKKFKKKVKKEYINFTLNKVETLEKGDISDILLNDYGGYIGVKYY